MHTVHIDAGHTYCAYSTFTHTNCTFINTYCTYLHTYIHTYITTTESVCREGQGSGWRVRHQVLRNFRQVEHERGRGLHGHR